MNDAAVGAEIGLYLKSFKEISVIVCDYIQYKWQHKICFFSSAPLHITGGGESWGKGEGFGGHRQFLMRENTLAS